MVREYSRHGPTQAFGVVCSASSNSLFDGKLAYVPALEDVLVWDSKKGEMVNMWHETGHKAEVTCIERSEQADTFAVGYADGSIRLWNSSTSAVVATFMGHKKAVTALAFDERGTRLASGSQDTDLIVWDTVAETGLYRLRGHRDQINSIKFINSSLPSTSTSSALLLTAAKDTFLKLWDLSTQHCIQTIVAHKSEVWTMDLDNDQTRVLTGSSDGELKLWFVNHDNIASGLGSSESGELRKMIQPLSTLPLSTKHRVTQISFHPTLPYLAVQSSERSVEIFRIRTEDEIRKKRARRRKRNKEKQKAKSQDVVEGEEDDDDAEIQPIELYTPYLVVRSNGKVRSFDFGPEKVAKTGVQIMLALSSNSLEVHTIPEPTKTKGQHPPEAVKLHSVDLPGHRTDVRTLCLSSDDTLLASASNGSLKIWNVKTTTCIRTMDCGYAICSTFLPGDRHIAVGCKSGEITVYDLASSTVTDTIKAHSSTVWSIHVRSDDQALVSGSADKDVKFWDFETVEREGKKISTLVHTKTLKMADDVLAVRYSPNGKYLAVSLLDSTVKVYFADSLKFYISLYGHKLPVLSMDISHDSKMIITCSADKNIKIWGLDFGDCHKSLFAHDESVMQVLFEKGTHYFWSVGKDKLLKYWDGDKFENIQKLEGHHSEIWALAVSGQGNFVVTGAHDKSIRIWEKLDEPLFLEEEREREMEQLYERGVADTLNNTFAIGDADGAPKSQALEASGVSHQTTETLMAGEKIMEALDLADAERAMFKEYHNDIADMTPEEAMKVQPPAKHPELAAYNLEPEAFVLKTVERIPAAALQDALLVLPFSKVISLMTYLSLWAEKNWNIALVSRIMFFMLKVHHHQIVANRVMRTALIPLRKHLRRALEQQKETISYNLAALQYIRRRNEAERIAHFYETTDLDEDAIRAKIADGKKRKRVAIKA